MCDTNRKASPDEAGILELFAEKHAEYDLQAVLRLTGVTPDRLEHAVTEGEVEPLFHDGVVAFAWEDVAFLALERWTPRRIARTLTRAGRAHALPYLNQLRTISVELPLYQIRLLHFLAKVRTQEGRPPLAVSDVLEYELDALASQEELPAVCQEIAGFEAAANFPAFEGGQQFLEHSCNFCGTSITAAEDVCVHCCERHVPSP